MQVTQVSIQPTEASNLAGRPALTPELLAASGARYSRNNEGLGSILSKIDPNNLDKSVDGIFRMIDYGHQSIADMAPVAMFIDGVSLYLAYVVWSLCPTPGGQESSTRYLHLGSSACIDAEVLGIPGPLRSQWQQQVEQSLAAYSRALTLWEQVAESESDLLRIPRSLLDDPGERAAKQVARMKRNFAFNRARNLLPVCASTNVMLVMSARGWVQLCQHLRSNGLLEARSLGAAITGELQLVAPRLLKHAVAQPSHCAGQERAWQRLVEQAQAGTPPHLHEESASSECPPRAHIEVQLPPGIDAAELSADLQFHEHRYAWMGDSLKRTTVRFGWEAVALAEVRDLNRHRTGTKWCPLQPVGFYAAADQWPAHRSANNNDFAEASELGRGCSARAHALLAEAEPTYIYWTLLGTQYRFEHVTVADKFLYEAELRTGTGAHFRYAQHLRDALALWYDRFPETRGLVLEGSAEPE